MSDALRVVYETSRKRGPMLPTSMPITMGPPANPMRTGPLMPGSMMGIVPMARPRSMPRKMAPRLGSLSVCTALPKYCSTFSKASCSPTTVTRSPYCRRRSFVPRSLVSPRVTRLTFTPYVLRSCRLPSFLPLSIGRVITTTFDSTVLSMWFQSILSLFQSLSTFLPRSSSIPPTSSSVVTTRTLSPSFSLVVEMGTITCSLRHIRETIKRI